MEDKKQIRLEAKTITISTKDYLSLKSQKLVEQIVNRRLKNENLTLQFTLFSMQCNLNYLYHECFRYVAYNSELVARNKRLLQENIQLKNTLKNMHGFFGRHREDKKERKERKERKQNNVKIHLTGTNYSRL